MATCTYYNIVCDILTKTNLIYHINIFLHRTTYIFMICPDQVLMCSPSSFHILSFKILEKSWTDWLSIGCDKVLNKFSKLFCSFEELKDGTVLLLSWENKKKLLNYYHKDSRFFHILFKSLINNKMVLKIDISLENFNILHEKYKILWEALKIS